MRHKRGKEGSDHPTAGNRPSRPGLVAAMLVAATGPIATVLLSELVRWLRSL